MSLLKLHRNILWKNKTEPSLNEKNLNQYDHELDGMDDRIIDLYSTKLPTQEAGHFITDIDVNQADGVITVTYYSGRKVRYDTNLEKIPFNYRFDEVTQILYIIADDGTEQICNLSSLITQHEFQESGTITFDVSSDGKVMANIKEGAITEDLLQPNFLADVRIEAGRALAGAEAAAESATNAGSSAEIAGTSAQAATTAARESVEHAANASASAATAAAKAGESSDSATEAKESEDRAKGSEAAAMESKEAAARSAQDSAASASASGESASSAASSAGQAGEQALLAKSYAVGTEGIVRPGDATDNSQFFSELARKLTEDAQKLLDQSQKLVSAATAGSIIPAGTVAFEDLPEEPKIGYMYNIANAFTTDARFVEGSGVYYNAGANVYWTKDGQWDVMIGVQVAGVKGAAESDYHQGYVNITPASIGLGNVNNTADADKIVKAAGTATKADQDGEENNIADTYLRKMGDSKDNTTTFTSGDSANPTGWADVGVISSGEKHSSLWHKFSLVVNNTRYLRKMMGNTGLSIGDGTVTGAISVLNTGLIAICSYYQSNTQQITDGYVDVAIQGYNTSADIFDYDTGGVLIKKPGIYAVECHYHIMSVVNDLSNIKVICDTGANIRHITKTICTPITCQMQEQLVTILKIDVATRVLLGFDSQYAKSYVFSFTETNNNYIIVKKLT